MTTIPFVFASGLGVRLRPLTNRTPKPLLPVKGNLSFLDLNIQRFIKYGFKKCFVNYSYRKDLFVDLHDRYSAKIDIVLVEDKKPLGQGGVLLSCRDKLKEGDVVFGVNGDTFVDFDLDRFLKLASPDQGFVLSSAEVEKLPKALLCRADGALLGLQGREVRYYYQEGFSRESVVVKNCLGLYLIPVPWLFKPDFTGEFIALFGLNDLFYRLVGEGTMIRCVERFPVKNFYTMNTKEDYEDLKERFKVLL